MLGFPIRTSSDQRSVGSSPRLIAASYVLHRPLMPRHPPCALKHLRHKKPIENKNQNCTSTHTKPAPPTKSETTRSARVRCSQPLSTNQTPHPTTKTGEATTTPTPQPGRLPPPKERGANGPVVSGPNSVSGNSFDQRVIPADQRLLSYAPAEAAHYRRRRQSQPPSSRNLYGDGGNPGSGHVNGAP